MLMRYMMLLVVLFCSMTSQAETIDMHNPYQMMKQVSEKTFQRLKSEQGKIHQDPNYLKVIVKDELMPYVNYQYAALKLLGPYLKGAKRDDVLAFIDAFQGYLISSYAQVLTQYSDQDIQFGPAPKIDATDRIATVMVNIIDTPNPDIKLEFKLRKSKAGEWQAFDMIAEGISMLSSKRSEWSGKINNDGILAVANELKDLSQQPITIEKKKS